MNQSLAFSSADRPDSGSHQDPLTIAAGKSAFNPLAGRRILVAEDDEPLAGFLLEELRMQEFAVEAVHDGETALGILQGDSRFDLLICDLNLPKIDGISLIQRAKPNRPRMPILVLTARSRVEDKVLALKTGADDCLVKPFSILELLARVEAVLRRNSGLIQTSSQVADLTLNREERRVERNGRRIDLTPREFAMLEFMMRHAQRPVSRATLLEEVWNMPPEPSTNIVDVYMKYLRDKIDGPGEQKLIQTIRGIGYELRGS